MSDQDEVTFSFNDWFLEQLDDAPDAFRTGCDTFLLYEPMLNSTPSANAAESYAHFIQLWQAAIEKLQPEGRDWLGSAWCCLAHYLLKAERFQDATEAAQTGRDLGLKPVGAWYYYKTSITTTDVPGASKLAAFSEAEEGAEYFEQAGWPELASDFHFRYALLCCQQADMKGSGPAAKQYLGQAVDGIARYLTIMKADADPVVTELLAAMGNAAKRIGLTPDDCRSLLKTPEIRPVVEPYLGWPNPEPAEQPARQVRPAKAKSGCVVLLVGLLGSGTLGIVMALWAAGVFA